MFLFKSQSVLTLLFSGLEKNREDTYNFVVSNFLINSKYFMNTQPYSATYLMPFLAAYSLPCHTKYNETGLRAGENAILSNCTYRSKPIPCSDVFDFVPTSYSFCCALNQVLIEISSSLQEAEKINEV